MIAAFDSDHRVAHPENHPPLVTHITTPHYQGPLRSSPRRHRAQFQTGILRNLTLRRSLCIYYIATIKCVMYLMAQHYGTFLRKMPVQCMYLVLYENLLTYIEGGTYRIHN